MNIQTYHLQISDDTRTLELFYSGNSEIHIKSNVPFNEDGDVILFPRVVLEKFLEIINEA